MTDKCLQEIERSFEERIKKPSGLAAQRDLEAGHWISFREKNTPAGHVMRRHPDGRVEMVKINLVRSTSKRAI